MLPSLFLAYKIEPKYPTIFCNKILFIVPIHATVSTAINLHQNKRQFALVWGFFEAALKIKLVQRELKHCWRMFLTVWNPCALACLLAQDIEYTAWDIFLDVKWAFVKTWLLPKLLKEQGGHNSSSPKCKPLSIWHFTRQTEVPFHN